MPNTPIAHRYAVAFDSVLGLQIKNYIARCLNAETAAQDFAASRARLYGLTCVTPDTELVFAEDCEAGGLLGFSIPKKTYDDLATDMRVAILWDAIPDTVGAAEQPTPPSNNVLVFPRCEIQTHHIRYGRAVELHRSGTAEWEFKMESSGARSEKRVKRYTYDEVRKVIKPADVSALVRKPGDAPALGIRLAFGRQYVINTDTLPRHMLIAVSTYQQEAIELYKEMSNLPSVPAMSLARTLQLDTVTDKDFRTRCFCRWETDEAHQRYIITTGLTSSRADMKEL